MQSFANTPPENPQGRWTTPGAGPVELGFSYLHNLPKILDVSEAVGETRTWKDSAGPVHDLVARALKPLSASVSSIPKLQQKRSRLHRFLDPRDPPRRLENALRMVRKTPGRGEQVASVRPPRGDESADRCPRTRSTLSPCCPPRARGPKASRASVSARPPRVRGAQPGREAARPASLRAVPGAHAAAGTRGPSPPGRGASWRRSPHRLPAAAHQFPEPTMHTFRGAAAMARMERSSPTRASPSRPPACLRAHGFAHSGSRGPRPSRLSANGRKYRRPGAPGHS